LREPRARVVGGVLEVAAVAAGRFWKCRARALLSCLPLFRKARQHGEVGRPEHLDVVRRFDDESSVAEQTTLGGRLQVGAMPLAGEEGLACFRRGAPSPRNLAG